MKSYEIINELKCWSGYHRVKGRPAGSPGSCAKNTNEQAPDLAGTGYQQGNSIVKAASGQIQQDIGTANAVSGTLQNIDKLRQGGPNMTRNTAPAVDNMIGGMKTAQTDVNKKLAIAGVGQMQPTQPTQPQQPKDLSQYKDDELEEQDTQPEQKPEQKEGPSMRDLLGIITTVGRGATSMQGRDLGADLKADVKTMIRNKVTGEPNK